MALPTVAATYQAGAVTLSGTLDTLRLTTVGGVETFDLGAANITHE